MTFFYYFVVIINWLMVIAKKKSKLVLGLDIFFCIIYIYGTTTTPDYINYRRMYMRGIGRSKNEIVFNVLMDFSKFIGVSYDQFRLILLLIFGAIILYVFSRFSNNYPAFFGTYLIYMALIDNIQIRNFCASAVFSLAMYFLFKYDRYTFAFLFMVVATLIHGQMAFYIPFIFVYMFRRRVKILFRLTCVCAVFLFVFLKFGDRDFVLTIGRMIIHFLGLNKDKMLYFTTNSHWGFLLYYMLHLTTIIMTFLCKHFSLRCVGIHTHLEFQNKIELLQLYCLLVFPMIYVNMNFYRIYRNLFFLNCITWCISLDRHKTITNYYYRCVLCIFISTIVFRIPLVQGNNYFSKMLNTNRYFNELGTY